MGPAFQITTPRGGKDKTMTNRGKRALANFKTILDDSVDNQDELEQIGAAALYALRDVLETLLLEEVGSGDEPSGDPDLD
jgi:hypothetical protein